MRNCSPVRIVEVSSVGFKCSNHALGPFQTVGAFPHLVHAFKNLSQHKMQLRIGLFGQLAIRRDVIDLSLQSICQGYVIGRGELTGVNAPKR